MTDSQIKDLAIKVDNKMKEDNKSFISAYFSYNKAQFTVMCIWLVFFIIYCVRIITWDSDILLIPSALNCILCFVCFRLNYRWLRDVKREIKLNEIFKKMDE